jgi:hypothetical protein
MQKPIAHKITLIVNQSDRGFVELVQTRPIVNTEQGKSMPPAYSYKMRNLEYLKPDAFSDYLTIYEVAKKVERDPSWIRKLERADRIPKAARVKCGKLQVRLWSPEQVTEIQLIIDNMRMGRPPK